MQATNKNICLHLTLFYDCNKQTTIFLTSVSSCKQQTNKKRWHEDNKTRATHGNANGKSRLKPRTTTTTYFYYN